MRCLSVSVVCLLSLCWTTQVQAQKGKKITSPAELLPANTLAYAEVHKPGDFAKEVRGLFKGSYLFNVPNSLAKLKAKYKDVPPYGFPWEFLEGCGLAFAPEITREIQRTQGAAVALTDLRLGDGEPAPDYVVILLPGKSNIPTFAMRVLMTQGRSKVVETVEKVKIHRHYSYRKAEGIDIAPHAEKESSSDKEGGCSLPSAQPERQFRYASPAYAMMPGAILVGSPKAVKQVILRAKGKAKGPSLADNKLFQETMDKVGAKAGIAGYVNVASSVELIVKLVADEAPPEIRAWLTEYFRSINSKAFRSYGIALGLEKGTLGYREVVMLDPKEKSPLMELMPGRPVNADLLHYVPQDAFFAATVANDNGAARWNKLLAFYDKAFPPFIFGGKKPSQMLKKVEDKLGVDFGKDVFANVTDIMLVLGNVLEAKVQRIEEKRPNFSSTRVGPQIPMYAVLQTKNEASAKEMLNVVGKICNAVARKPLKRNMRKIKGHTVYEFPINRYYSVDVAVSGRTVLIGPYAEPIVGALSTASEKNGLLADAKVAARIQQFKDSPILILAKPSAALAAMASPVLVVAWFAVGSKDVARQDVKPSNEDLEKDAGCQPKNNGEPEVKPTKSFVKDSPQIAKIKKRLGQIFKKEQWFILGIEVGENYILEHGEAPKMPQTVAALTNLGIEMYFDLRRQRVKALEDREKAIEDFKKNKEFKDGNP